MSTLRVVSQIFAIALLYFAAAIAFIVPVGYVFHYGANNLPAVLAPIAFFIACAGMVVWFNSVRELLDRVAVFA